MGFFSKEDLIEMGADVGDKRCQECGLAKGCISPKMPVRGEGRRRILALGEAPGETEDQENAQFRGKAGQYLRKKVNSYPGWNFDRDLWTLNAINCRPHEDGKNAEPTKKEVQCCKGYVDEVIDQLKPEFIWLLGGKAVESFYLERTNKSKITTWRGLIVPDKKYDCWVLPQFHPSFGVRNENDEIVQSVINRDLTRAIEFCNTPGRPEFVNPFGKIKVIKDHAECVAVLKRVLQVLPRHFVFDYETNGKKPMEAGHKIVSISFCYDNGTAYSFPLHYNNFWGDGVNEILELWKKILLHIAIGKIAHNMKFEDIWSRKTLGVTPENFMWCTMNGAHIEDSRRGLGGLKMQAYINWGIEGYEKNIEPYVKGRPFNKIEQCPIDDLLLYGGVDSLIAFWLLQLQQEHFKEEPNLGRANSFIIESLHTMTDIQQNGVNMDKKYYSQMFLDTTDVINAAEQRILDYPEVKRFRQLRQRDINLGSSDDLRYLLFKIMGLKADKHTATNKESTDASVINNLDIPFAKDLLYLRKMEKVRNTYIAQFLREIEEDGRMRPFFDLNTVQTFRSSSSMPNFQNIPVRDEEAKKYARSGIIPSKGNIILDWDYGAQEFRVASCYCEDPIMVAYCKDPNADIHRDTAAEITGLAKQYVTKMIRFHSKNGWVFPEIYGSYFKSCAKSLWSTIMELPTGHADNITVKQYMYEIGILKSKTNPYNDFEKHCMIFEKEWWDRYKVLKKWQEKMWKKFIEKGYVEMMHGFKVGGYLSRNDIINYPIQGSAFHCLLYSANNINKIAKDERWNTKIIAQIHDNCIYDADPAEERRVVQVSNEVATKRIREDNPWIIVPLIMEWEKTEIDGNWFTKHYYKEVT